MSMPMLGGMPPMGGMPSIGGGRPPMGGSAPAPKPPQKKASPASLKNKALADKLGKGGGKK